MKKTFKDSYPFKNLWNHTHYKLEVFRKSKPDSLRPAVILYLFP